MQKTMNVLGLVYNMSISLLIKYEPDEKLKKLPTLMSAASNSSKWVTANYLSNKIRECINTGNYGSWPIMKDVTKQWHKSSSSKPLSFLSMFVKAKVVGNKISSGFISLDKYNKIGYKFKEYYLNLQQDGGTVPVTKKMRGYFAKKSFPLLLSTDKLTIPKRPIIDPTLFRIRRTIPDIYEKRFKISLEDKLK